MDIVERIGQRQLKTVPPFRAGDTVIVHVKVKEGDKERIQAFEGVVIARKGSGINESFTVRKISFGVGVERVFPLHAASVEKIVVKQRGKVRRAKLYYLRELAGRAARIEEGRAIVTAIGDAADDTLSVSGETDEAAGPAADEEPQQEAAAAS